MYRELATIKDGDNITGFVVHDGTSVSVLGIEQMKEKAAKGDIDTLSYKYGKFIPIIQGKLARELRKKFLLRRYKKVCRNMTFEDFVEMDCIFRQKDVELMTNNDIKDGHIVLANVCAAFELKNPYAPNSWMLMIAFWSPDSGDMARVRDYLIPYLKHAKNMRDYGNFIMVNLSLCDAKTGFDLFTFHREAGVNVLYNLDVLSTMDKRIDYIIQSSHYLTGKLLNVMRPTKNGMYNLATILMASNAMAMDKLLKITE